MGAIRAEMPGVSIAFTSVGMGHGVFALSEVSGLKSHGLKHSWETGRSNARRLSEEWQKVLKHFSTRQPAVGPATDQHV